MVTVSGSRVESGRVAMWRVPRTRGATSGVLLVLLGAWGALVPFIGPHFGYAYTPNTTWTMTAGRLWLEVVPGTVAFLCGLVLIGSASRAIGLWAGWLSAVAGAWFAVGPVMSRLWTNGALQAGSPVAGGSTVRGVVEELGFFTGLGVVIVFLAAAALGRFSVIGVREHMAAMEAPVVDEAAPPPTIEEAPTTQLPTRVPLRREPKHALDPSDTTVIEKDATKDKSDVK